MNTHEPHPQTPQYALSRSQNRPPPGPSLSPALCPFLPLVSLNFQLLKPSEMNLCPQSSLGLSHWCGDRKDQEVGPGLLGLGVLDVQVHVLPPKHRAGSRNPGLCLCAVSSALCPPGQGQPSLFLSSLSPVSSPRTCLWSPFLLLIQFIEMTMSRLILSGHLFSFSRVLRASTTLDQCSFPRPGFQPGLLELTPEAEPGGGCVLAFPFLCSHLEFYLFSWWASTSSSS